MQAYISLPNLTQHTRANLTSPDRTNLIQGYITQPHPAYPGQPNLAWHTEVLSSLTWLARTNLTSASSPDHNLTSPGLVPNGWVSGYIPAMELGVTLSWQGLGVGTSWGVAVFPYQVGGYAWVWDMFWQLFSTGCVRLGHDLVCLVPTSSVLNSIAGM